MSLLEQGLPFPPEDQVIRIKTQTMWEQMLKSEFTHQMRIGSDGKPIKVDPIIPLPAMVSEIYSDLLFGEWPNITSGNETVDNAVKEFTKLRTMQTDYLEGAALNSAVGTVFQYFFKIEGKVYWKFIPANRVLWEEDESGKLWEVLTYETHEIDKINRWIKYRVVRYIWLSENEIILNDLIVKVDRKDKNKVVEIVENAPPVNVAQGSRLDKIPVVKIVNLGQSGTFNGKSDYEGKEQMFAEVDNRVDQINHILQEHSEPWAFLPAGVIDNRGNFRRSQGKWVEKSPVNGDNSVEFSTWNASLESQFGQIEQLVKMIFMTSRISAPIAGLDMGGQAESGRALKWRSVSTLSSVNRRRLYWNQAFKQAFDILSKMEDSLESIDAADLRIEWQDGLPMDMTEITQNVVQLVNAQLMSKLTGIQKTSEQSEAEAQDELDQINKEQTEEAKIESVATTPITL